MICKMCGSEIPDDAHSCPHCGEVLKTEEKRPIESPTIDYQIKKSIAFKLRSSSSNPDFKLYLDSETESVSLLQYIPSKFYFIVEKLSSARISDVKVQLSGPPQIKLLIKSREVDVTIMKNKFYFTIVASEPGFFIMTATLTSNVGHRIAFPFEVRVEPKSFSHERINRRNRFAMIIIGLIGGILLLVGIFNLLGGYGQVLSFPLALTLAVIGFLILSGITGIASKGECCWGCSGSCSGC